MPSASSEATPGTLPCWVWSKLTVLYSWAGKASFCLGDVKRGKAEYKLAIVQDSSSLAAWEGLAELQMANGEVGEAQQTFEQLV